MHNRVHQFQCSYMLQHDYHYIYLDVTDVDVTKTHQYWTGCENSMRFPVEYGHPSSEGVEPDSLVVVGQEDTAQTAEQHRKSWTFPPCEWKKIELTGIQIQTR